jgi:hypothetical protein
VREHLAHPCIDFVEPDNVRLKSPMRIAVHWPESQRDEIRVFLKGSLKSVIVTLVIEALDSACYLKGSSHTRDHVPISLAIKLYLSCLVLHQLGLVSTFN